MSASATLIARAPQHADVRGGGESDAPCTSGSDGDWVWSYVTRIGRRHSTAGGVCEDAAGVCVEEHAPRGGIHLALADGVSGGACGDIAASTLVKHCLSWPSEESTPLDQWIGEAAEISVQRALAANTPHPGAATLVAAWLKADGSGTLSRVGDCRAYAWQASGDSVQVHQLLPDQTMAYMGYASPLSPKANQPAHMVGNHSTGIPELLPITIPLYGGLLLCSDGLHDVVDAGVLGHMLAPLTAKEALCTDPAQFKRVCLNLVNYAQRLGSDDDVSVLLVARTPSAK